MEKFTINRGIFSITFFNDRLYPLENNRYLPIGTIYDSLDETIAKLKSHYDIFRMRDDVTETICEMIKEGWESILVNRIHNS